MKSQKAPRHEGPPPTPVKLVSNQPFLTGDCLEVLKRMASESVDCVITSPPYWQQRIYEGRPEVKDTYPLGEEPDYRDYINKMALIFSEVKRVLKNDGSLWLNLGDKYLNKNLVGIPWRVAIALQDDGWVLRNDIIWDQMKGTQSAKDRLRDVYEHVFHFVKCKKYYFNDNAVRIKPSKHAVTNGEKVTSATGVSGKKYFKQIEESASLTPQQKNKALEALNETLNEMRLGTVVDFRMTIRGFQRTFHSDNHKVSGRAKELEERGYYILKMRASGFLPSDIWRIVPEDKWRKDTHYAVFPQELLRIPINATCPPHGLVLDPFSGTGSTVISALKMGRRGVGIEMSTEYNRIAQERLEEETGKDPSFLPFV